MSLKYGDLKNSVSEKVHIDEYKAKMGEDHDVIVLSFKVSYRDQAYELVNFFEKGYEWVLDSDVSSGEMEDGSYLVFIEALRRPSLSDKIIDLLDDLERLVDVDQKHFTFAYYKDHHYMPLTKENLENVVPLEPRKYKQRVSEREEGDMALESMKNTAGIKIKAKEILDPELQRFINLSR